MEWEIQGLSKSCVKCEVPFREGEGFYNFLVLSSEGVPLRNDFCVLCFDSVKTSWMSRTDLYSYWQGLARFSQKPPRVQPLPYEKFELLLRKHIQSSESRDQKFAYILALLLERKKILIPREGFLKEGEAEKFLVYEHRDTAESFILEDPHLTLDQIGKVETELRELMDQEFQFELQENSSTPLSNNTHSISSPVVGPLTY